MEGPRSVRADELPSLSRLVDTVFVRRPTIPNMMFAMFEPLFSDRNLDNLLVFSDRGEIVSHFGMIQRWASVGGCALRVACVGAVSTYEGYRGRGLATQLFDYARARALEGGVDFMMISGGRGLYQRAGAAVVDAGEVASIDALAADALRKAFDVKLRPFQVDDLPEWIRCYEKKHAHFMRLREDWDWLARSRYCMCVQCDFLSIGSGDATLGYLAIDPNPAEGRLRVLEWGGDAPAVATALGQVCKRTGANTVHAVIPRCDTALRALLAAAGAQFSERQTSNTVLLINLGQLAARLTPWVQSRTGAAACALSIEQNAQSIVFRLGRDTVRTANLMAAAQFLFGPATAIIRPGALGRTFPLPALEYGLSYT